MTPSLTPAFSEPAWGAVAALWILQVHDELVFDAVREEVDYVTPKVRELMTPALLLPRGMPLEAKVGTGDSWLKAHQGNQW